MSYICATCKLNHEDVPLSFGAEAPYWFDVVAPEERNKRIELSSDQCVIDEEHFFIRGCLEIPIVGSNEKFTWGVWSSLIKDNFLRATELWNVTGRESEPPYFGWLSTKLPLYPDTLNLKCHVHTRPVGERPLIELEVTNHPVSIEQSKGISIERAHEIVGQLFYHSDS